MTALNHAAPPGPATAASGTARAVFLVFLPFAGGYFLSYLYRTVNAIIAPRLVEDIGLGAADLGLLTAAYFLGFAAFQLPLGLLLDRYGPRRVQAGLLLVAAAGALVFGSADSEAGLIAGRAMIGMGVAGGLMASFKAITLWFPQERWPLVNGFFLCMGGLGAMSATTPVELLLGVTDWRGIFLGLSVATLCASALIFLVVPERRIDGEPATLRDQLQGLSIIYADRLFWRLAPISMATMGATLAIQSLWAGPWLRDVARLSDSAVADYLFVTTASMTVGFVGTGLVVDYLRRFGIGVLEVMVGGTAILILSQAAMVFTVHPTGYWPWVLFGLTNNITALSYPLLSRHFPLSYAGRAGTAINLLVFASAFAAQYIIGAIIGLWPEGAEGHYDTEAYPFAFGGFLALQIVAFAWLLVPARPSRTGSGPAASRNGSPGR